MIDGMEVEVVRSPRRRRTVQASVVDGRIRLLLPGRMSRDEEAYWVAEMRRRLGDLPVDEPSVVDLVGRASRLAARYRLPVPSSIRWVTNQRSRWGSCTPADGAIRISSRLQPFPDWVLDYVIVHELAHLVVLSHGPEFRALEHRYPRAERAIGFLIAKGMGGDEVSGAGSGAAARPRPRSRPVESLTLF